MTHGRILMLTEEEFKARWPVTYDEHTKFIDGYYSEDGERDEKQVNEEMTKIGGPEWKFKVKAASKFGEIDAIAFTYWDDPFAPASAGYDGVTIYQADGDFMTEIEGMPDAVEKLQELVYGELFK